MTYDLPYYTPCKSNVFMAFPYLHDVISARCLHKILPKSLRKYCINTAVDLESHSKISVVCEVQAYVQLILMLRFHNWKIACVYPKISTHNSFHKLFSGMHRARKDFESPSTHIPGWGQTGRCSALCQFSSCITSVIYWGPHFFPFFVLCSDDFTV